ncbi:hypothetical protein AC578_3061 [Pseudocercospora eumusae]|uniref:Myb-like domain-containing protein n=1 Tax=Pseudocercospora eumusae TaxID=321146 RepID=A0A139H478_9PEZI|nr:hypothetical protein AC578_3061 [Pseudocercospora eumusae]
MLRLRVSWLRNALGDQAQFSVSMNRCGRHLTEDEKQRLVIKMYTGKSAHVIRKRAGKSVKRERAGKSVKRERAKQGQAGLLDDRRPLKRFTPEEDARLLAARPQDFGWTALRNQFPGRSLNSLRSRYFRLQSLAGNSEPAFQANRWDENQTDQLRHLSAQGLSIAEISTKLGRSYESIQCKLRTFKNSPWGPANQIRPRKRWTKDEVSRLKALYEEGLSTRDIAMKLNKSVEAAQQLGAAWRSAGVRPTLTAFLLPPNPMDRHGMDTALLPRQRGKAALYLCRWPHLNQSSRARSLAVMHIALTVALLGISKFRPALAKPLPEDGHEAFVKRPIYCDQAGDSPAQFCVSYPAGDTETATSTLIATTSLYGPTTTVQTTVIYTTTDTPSALPASTVSVTATEQTTVVSTQDASTASVTYTTFSLGWNVTTTEVSTQPTTVVSTQEASTFISTEPASTIVSTEPASTIVSTEPASTIVSTMEPTTVVTTEYSTLPATTVVSSAPEATEPAITSEAAMSYAVGATATPLNSNTSVSSSESMLMSSADVMAPSSTEAASMTTSDAFQVTPVSGDAALFTPTSIVDSETTGTASALPPTVTQTTTLIMAGATTTVYNNQEPTGFTYSYDPATFTTSTATGFTFSYDPSTFTSEYVASTATTTFGEAPADQSVTSTAPLNFPFLVSPMPESSGADDVPAESDSASAASTILVSPVPSSAGADEVSATADASAAATDSSVPSK